MKEVEINGKKHDLHFGVDSIREMDKRCRLVNENGVSFGLGLTNVVIYIQNKNPAILAGTILSATYILKSIPSSADIEKWLEEREDLEKVFDDFLSVLKTVPLMKSRIKEMLGVVKDWRVKRH